jgi:hypothetical protein
MSVAAFDVVDDGLEKYLRADDFYAVVGLQATQDGSRFTVHQVEIGKIDRDITIEIGSGLSGDFFQEDGVGVEEIAVDAEDHSAAIILLLCYMRRHFSVRWLLYAFLVARGSK